MASVTNKMRAIDICDLPSDTQGSIPFRRDLIRTVNAARGLDDKMELIRKTLTFVLAHIENGMKEPKTKTKKEA